MQIRQAHLLIDDQLQSTVYLLGRILCFGEVKNKVWYCNLVLCQNIVWWQI